MKKQLLIIFFFIVSLFIQAQGPPAPCGLSTITECEFNSDGIATFDLTVWSTFCNVDPNDVGPINYYLTEADAVAQTNAIPNPNAYTNTTNPQLIYYSANLISNGNLVFAEDSVEVINTPVANTPTDLVVCQDDLGGIANFTLDVNTQQILGGLDPVSYAVTYHISQFDAESQVNPLADPYTNISNPQTIYAVIESNTGNCISNMVSFQLIVNTIDIVPTVNALEICGDGQGFGVFDLTQNEDIITSGNTNLSITYYETQVDAYNGTNAIPNTQAYNNTIPFNQTIYYAVEDLTTGCRYVDTNTVLHLIVHDIILEVDSSNVINDCAANGSGSVTLNAFGNGGPYQYNINGGVFQSSNTFSDLSAGTYTFTAIDGSSCVPASITVTIDGASEALTLYADPIIDDCYGLSEGEVTLIVNGGVAPYTFSADGGLTYQASNVFTSLTAGTYVFAVMDAINCVEIIDVFIEQSAPVIQPTPLYEQDLDGDGIAAFNLDSKVDEITAGNSSLIVSFHETLTDAENALNPLVSPYNNIVAYSQTVYVRVDNLLPNCTSFTELELITEYIPFVVNEAILNACQTDPNFVETFDLTSAETDILNGLNPTEYTFTYYETSNQVNAIVDPTMYNNTSQQQILYVLVTETATGENVTTYLSLVVNELPIVDFDGGLLICDGETIELNPNTGNGNYTYQWNTGEDTSTILVNIGGTYSVTVINNNTGCMNDGTVFIDEGVAPIASNPSDLTSCNGNTVFDLTTTIPEITTNLNVTITFYESEISALTNQNPIINTTSYTSIVGLQTIYATVYDTANSPCFAIVSFNLITENCPVIVDCSANQPLNTSFCYTNNNTQQYNFTSNDGSPLYIVFNSGMTENNFDELIVLDSDGVTNLNADNPYGNAGDLSGLTFSTTGDSVTIYIQSDGSVISCTNDPIDFDVFCGSNFGFIEVNAFLDENNDGVFNGNDSAFTNGFFTYEINNDGNINTVNSNTGSFVITNQDETNSYDITFATNDGYENCFTIPTALFENVMVTTGNTITIDFPIIEAMPCEDLAVYLIPFSSPRPGFNYWNDLVIENLGATTITSGTVAFIHDPLVNYVDATPIDSGLTITPTATGANVDFTNLLPGETRTVWFRLYTPPSVNLGEFVTSSVAYTTTSNDIVSDNNVSVITQEVIGSYDPNDITESHGRDIIYDDFITTDEYLYYTIRFQNVGTAEAINVRIENTVSSLLDLSTLEFIRATHDVVMTQNNNQLTWTFDNINLPAQSQDDFGSNGYVHFKIKPTAGYAIGTMIPNTAEIYFDFNAPVITNTFVTNFIENNLSISDFDINSFSLYPNPAKDIVTIKLNSIVNGETSIDVIDIQGKRIINKVLSNQTQELQLNVSNLEAGVYFVKLKNNDNETIKKLVVE
ncbi:T9SS type A sorting domain-containing protein [uncultured Lacinutrix sp.]|uniref:T9SS type A sorting domain-containing protein n=1 Tax=uncultured Lacinutrix sp. TaxID=574032 RepID=UPI002625CD64|nr:T9SS type A sorting domain-containing protein [uncultured Lacinutrix sp.]